MPDHHAGPGAQGRELLIMPENIRVADEVWIAVASLQRNHPWRTDFTIDEIMEQAEAANMTIGRCDPRSGPMSVFIASPTGLPALSGIACSSKRRLAAVVRFVRGTLATPAGRPANRCRIAMKSRHATANSSTGTLPSTFPGRVQIPWTPFWPCADWARRSGPTKLPMTTCGANGRIGNEQNVPGHESVRRQECACKTNE